VTDLMLAKSKVVSNIGAIVNVGYWAMPISLFSDLNLNQPERQSIVDLDRMSSCLLFPRRWRGHENSKQDGILSRTPKFSLAPPPWFGLLLLVRIPLRTDQLVLAYSRGLLPLSSCHRQRGLGFQIYSPLVRSRSLTTIYRTFVKRRATTFQIGGSGIRCTKLARKKFGAKVYVILCRLPRSVGSLIVVRAILQTALSVHFLPSCRISFGAFRAELCEQDSWFICSCICSPRFCTLSAYQSNA